MRTILKSFLIFAALSFPAFSDELPPEAKHLQLIKEREIAKIEAKYQKAMQELLEKFTKKGDLATANAINAEINKTKVKTLVGSKWEYRINGRLKSVFTFGKNGQVEGTNGYKGVSYSDSKTGLFNIHFDDGNSFPVDKDGKSAGGRTFKRMSK